MKKLLISTLFLMNVIHAVPEETTSPSINLVPGKGVTLSTPDKKSSLTIKNRLQMRETYQTTQTDSTSELNVRTYRLSLLGNILSPELKYNVQLAMGANDYETSNLSPLFDAYLDYALHPDLNLRFGQFFVPFDRARTIREFALSMVDRTLVVRELNLDRDMGVMLYSPHLSFVDFGYYLFLGGGDGRNKFGLQRMGPILTARVSYHPFGTFEEEQESDITREKKPRLAIGAAAAYNYHTVRQNSTFGTTFTKGYVDYWNYAFDVVFKYAGFSFIGEALSRRASPNRLDLSGPTVTTDWTRSADGYFLQAGMMLTEKIEAVGRWEQLIPTTDTDPSLISLANSQGNQLGAGFNYFINGHAFKVQTDYVYIFGRETNTPIHLARLQLDFTI